MAAGVSGLREMVSVRAWDVWAVSSRAGKVGSSVPLVRTLGENAGVSG